MNRRKIFFYSALIVTLSTLLLLATGSSLLTLAIDPNKSIPFGTLLTWAGMMALPLSLYWGIKELRKPTKTPNRLLSACIKILILLGILWVPISYLLAGNLSFSFSEKDTFQGGQAAMRWFWRLSYGIPAGVLITALLYWMSLLKKKGPDKNQ